MALENVVSMLLGVSVAVGLGVGLLATILRLRAPAPSSASAAGRVTPANPGAATASDLRAARVVSTLLVLAWAVVAEQMAPDAPKTQAIGLTVAAAGLLAGLLTLGPDRLVLGGDGRLRGPANFAWVVAGYAFLAMALPSAATRQWAAVGGATGLAIPALVAAVFRLEGRASAGALLAAQGAALVGALVWGDRLRSKHGAGLGIAVSWGAAVALFGALGAFAFSGRKDSGTAGEANGIKDEANGTEGEASASGIPLATGPRPDPAFQSAIAAGLLAALAAYPLIALALREPSAAIPAAIGAGMAAFFAMIAMLWQTSESEPPPALAFGLLLLGAGTLLLVNRLYGMAGLGLCGVGLAALGTADGRALRWLAVLLPAAFGGRALLHVFLDRTYLRLEGVDVSQTYAFAALILGFAFATALVRFKDFLAPGPVAGAVGALFLISSPLLVGYFIHLLPLAGFIAGIIAAAFGLAALCDGLESAAARLGPFLVMSCAGAAAAAPYLTSISNAPRQQRIVVFIVVAVLGLWYAGSALRSQLQRPAAA